VTRVVIDAGVLIAGLISSSGAPAGLLNALGEGRFDLIICPMLLAEVRRALAYPKLERYVTADDADEFIGWLARVAITRPDPSAIPSVTRDPDDDYLFALAIEAGASLVVSGDADVLAARDIPVPTSTPRDFLDALLSAG
jgi:putative PIN family toxin of toxin-antitoxin system